MKTLLVVCLAALAIYMVLCAVMYWSQDRILYFPTPEIDRPGVRALKVKRADATVKVWALHPNAQPALLYFGGNGEDVGSNLHDFERAFPDRAIYLVNYRGYGRSEGSPTEAGCYASADAAYAWLTRTMKVPAESVAPRVTKGALSAFGNPVKRARNLRRLSVSASGTCCVSRSAQSTRSEFRAYISP